MGIGQLPYTVGVSWRSNTGLQGGDGGGHTAV